MKREMFFSTINIVKAAADFIHQCKYALVKKTKLIIRATHVLLYQVNLDDNGPLVVNYGIAAGEHSAEQLFGTASMGT